MNINLLHNSRRRDVLKIAYEEKIYRNRKLVWWAAMLSWRPGDSILLSALGAESTLLRSSLTFSIANWKSFGTWDPLIFSSIFLPLLLSESLLINSLEGGVVDPTISSSVKSTLINSLSWLVDPDVPLPPFCSSNSNLSSNFIAILSLWIVLRHFTINDDIVISCIEIRYRLFCMQYQFFWYYESFNVILEYFWGALKALFNSLYSINPNIGVIQIWMIWDSIRVLWRCGFYDNAEVISIRFFWLFLKMMNQDF